MYKLLVAVAIVVPLYLGLVFLSVRLGKEKDDFGDVALNLALIVLGSSLGWLIGIFLSPYDGGEEERFSGYASAISAFVSGYLNS